MAPVMSYALPAMNLMCNIVMPETPNFSIQPTGDKTTAMSYALPAMQLMCNIVMPETPSSNNETTGPTIDQSPSQVPPAILPEGYIGHPDIGVAYKISNSTVDWKTAKERCIAEGAHLAIINSVLKFERLMSQSTSTTPFMWIGIHRMYDGAEWVSMSTGITLTNLPWAPGEPSGDYDCVETSNPNGHGLKNYACNEPLHYVCEIPFSVKSNR